MTTSEHCKAHDDLNVTTVTSSGGYIASVVTSDTPYCEGTTHPWVIHAAPGQTINLTLYDFAVETVLPKKQQHLSKKPEQLTEQVQI